MKHEMDLYTDYLLRNFNRITAVKLSNLVDNSISHDKTTRMPKKNIIFLQFYMTT
jgi:hypothetical protein